MATDRDYQGNHRECNRAWREKNQHYRRDYRRRHPEYAERNPLLQKARRGRPRVAKMDASEKTSFLGMGTYWGTPEKSIAKMGNRGLAKLRIQYYTYKIGATVCKYPESLIQHRNYAPVWSPLRFPLLPGRGEIDPNILAPGCYDQMIISPFRPPGPFRQSRLPNRGQHQLRSRWVAFQASRRPVTNFFINTKRIMIKLNDPRPIKMIFSRCWNPLRIVPSWLLR